MFYLITIVFLLGYACIAFEHQIKVEKAATALLTAVILWVLFYFQGPSSLDNSRQVNYFLFEHLGKIAEILFFLLSAMTIVEVLDSHNCFEFVSQKIKTKNPIKLLWCLSWITFFMSAVLDNLTATIVMLTIVRKIIKQENNEEGDEQSAYLNYRWFYAGFIVLAANAGGAWSPIGDITTIMLWIGGQLTASNIITSLIIPSIFCLLVPLIIVSIFYQNTFNKLDLNSNFGNLTTEDLSVEINYNSANNFERNLFFAMGVILLLFVPVFKMLTGLPPYLAMIFALSIIWITAELLHKNKSDDLKNKLKVASILQRIDVPTILFFLGILLSVSALESAGHLKIMAKFLENEIGNFYVINLIIGFLSAIVDNVPLVAGAMGMYKLEAINSGIFSQDGSFWELLAYTSGTGGSMLIIGSAAGVAAMGIEKISFTWYLKNISWLALIGYFSGAMVYLLGFTF